MRLGLHRLYGEAFLKGNKDWTILLKEYGIYSTRRRDGGLLVLKIHERYFVEILVRKLFGVRSVEIGGMCASEKGLLVLLGGLSLFVAPHSHGPYSRHGLRRIGFLDSNVSSIYDGKPFCRFALRVVLSFVVSG